MVIAGLVGLAVLLAMLGRAAELRGLSFAAGLALLAVVVVVVWPRLAGRPMSGLFPGGAPGQAWCNGCGTWQEKTSQMCPACGEKRPPRRVWRPKSKRS